MKKVAQPTFSEIENAVSFYVRNDFAILNCLLVKDLTTLWEDALVAYKDNRDILEEYANGDRTIESAYDEKWIHALKGRLITDLDKEAKERIIQNARSDISVLLNAMRPAEKSISVYRTAWERKGVGYTDGVYPFSRQYPELPFKPGDLVTIRTITSTSCTPYREEELDVPFCRYELFLPVGTPVLELDVFESHNEEGEILLPPMRIRILAIEPGSTLHCRAIIKAAYEEKFITAYGEESGATSACLKP